MPEQNPESFATTDGKNEPANMQGSVRSSNSRSHAEIHDRTGLYISIIALVLSAMALGAVMMVPGQQQARVDVLGERAEKAEREARVMQERWNDLKVELARKGIAVSDH